MGHFSYNSVIFSTISANNFVTLSASRDFLRPNVTQFNLVDYSTDLNSQLVSIEPIRKESDMAGSLYRKAKLGMLEKLDAQHCIKAYAHTFISSRIMSY